MDNFSYQRIPRCSMAFIFASGLLNSGIFKPSNFLRSSFVASLASDALRIAVGVINTNNSVLAEALVVVPNNGPKTGKFRKAGQNRFEVFI